MQIVFNVSFHQETVVLDGKHFIDCTLEACELSYGGGAVIFERTRIEGCDYMFGGQARRTVELLTLMGLMSAQTSGGRGASGEARREVFN